MIKEQFFPTTIYGKDVKLDNQLFANEIVKWSKQDPGVKKTNRNGGHSTTEMHKMPVFQPLVNELFLMMQDIWKEEWLDREPLLGNMWANINPPGGSNRPHIHPNALFSGVYYVKCNSDSGRLKIYDPRPGNQYIMPIRKQGNPGIDFWREANLQPIDGRIIMFPAWLWHSVEDNTSNDIRISISFNFIQEGFNG